MALTQAELDYLLAKHAPNKDWSKFAPKMTPQQRCEAFALIKAGFSHGTVSVMYGVARATLTHMARPGSKFYKAVRDEYDTTGHIAFLQRYLTQPMIERASAINLEMVAAEKKEGIVRVAASSKKGRHLYGGYEFFIGYNEELHSWGLNETGPELPYETWEWNAKDDTPCVYPTSAAAYNAACKIIDIGYFASRKGM